MSKKPRCPRCAHSRSWKVRRDKLRCAACRYEWTPRPLPLGLTPAEWRRLLRWFVLGHTALTVARETHLERKKVLRSLLLVREAMIKDIPPPCPVTSRLMSLTWAANPVPGAAPTTPKASRPAEPP